MRDQEHRGESWRRTRARRGAGGLAALALALTLCAGLCTRSRAGLADTGDLEASISPGRPRSTLRALREEEVHARRRFSHQD